MATTISKQLGELLQEKQEPFMLDIYLLEKGCLRNRFYSDPSVRCSVNPKGLLKRSLRLGVNKSCKIIPNCAKVVKAVFGKIVLVSNRHKVKNDHRSNEEAVSSSFPENDTDNSPNSSQKEEIEKKKRLHLRYKKDNKELRLSPVSVLDRSRSCDDSSAHENRILMTKSVLAVRDCKFTVQLSPNEPKCTDFPSQYSSTKKILHQSKQLLFDCVRELLESNKWRNRKEKNLLQFFSSEEINKLLCEDIRVWSRLSGNESNLTQLLNVDFGASIGEWIDFEPQKREVSIEIGDAIFEDISKEIVEQMVSFC